MFARAWVTITTDRQERSTRVSITLPPELYQRLLKLSEQQKRSLSNLCALLLEAASEEASAEN